MGEIPQNLVDGVSVNDIEEYAEAWVKIKELEESGASKNDPGLLNQMIASNNALRRMVNAVALPNWTVKIYSVDSLPSSVQAEINRAIDRIIAHRKLELELKDRLREV